MVAARPRSQRAALLCGGPVAFRLRLFAYLKVPDLKPETNKPRSCNDINVLQRSPLMTRLAMREGPLVEFEANCHKYNYGYFLADDIYPRELIEAIHTFLARYRSGGTPCAAGRVPEHLRDDVEGPGPAALEASRLFVLLNHSHRWVLAGNTFGTPGGTSGQSSAATMSSSASQIVGEPVKYEDLPPEHKKRYDELKAILEANLIGAFEKTRSHGIKFKGFQPEGALDGLDLSLPSDERTRALRQEVNYAVAHSLHRHAESLVNTLERVALNVVQEVTKHKYSPSGPALGTHQGEVPLYTRPPPQHTFAAPQQQGSPAYVVYKVEGDLATSLYEPPKEIPHGYVCTYVPEQRLDDPGYGSKDCHDGGVARTEALEQMLRKAPTVDEITAIMRDQFGILPKKRMIGYSKPYPNDYDLIPLPPKYRLPDFTKFSGSEGTSSIEHVSRYLAQLGMVSASDELRVRFFSQSLTDSAHLEAEIIVICKSDVIKHMLSAPVLKGRLGKWMFALSEFDIRYQPAKAVKGQALADLIAERINMDVAALSVRAWTMFFDGSVCEDGCGIGMLLVSPRGATYSFSIRLSTPCTNNVVEYEAICKGMELLLDAGAEAVEIFGDSKLVISQLTEEYKCESGSLFPLWMQCRELMAQFSIEDATELRLWALEKIKENKAKVARAYNKKLKPKEFQVGDLLDGRKFPVAVNGQHLKKYFPSMWDDQQ
ncbi:hypothetical protein QYE76_066865 [Lolium multiflorum]|uniref:RNase H type-1 domain-containing protein n=1 Tax=Lolium multiflorum TaxID=4521 RepID=A0AAD8SBT1_LOLMU|nr:hypothetical protein QYE76_066865 [Lolium multiflorum]